MPTPTPALAKITRDGDTVTVRTKLPDADPISVRARVIEGELIVTAHTHARAGGASSRSERHRLIDLGPKLRPATTKQPS
jgi:hypothetical protein